MTWREEPLFDLAALDATGELAINRLRTESPYGKLFTGQPDMQAEVWYCRIGLASTLKAHKALDIRMDMGEGKRSLLVIPCGCAGRRGCRAAGGSLHHGVAG